MEQFRFKNNFQALSSLMQLLRVHPGYCKMSPENCYVFDLVLEEMGSNIIRYGYDDDICHEIMLSVEFQDNSAILELRDNGHAFNPLTDAPVPGLDLPLAERKIGGMGIYLTRKMCRNLTYRRDGCWNILTMEIGNKDR